MITSGRKLAKQLKVSESTVREYLSREDWPFRRSPPWTDGDVSKMRFWGRTTLSPNPADLVAVGGHGDGLDALRRNPLNAAKLKLTLTRAEKLELERRILAADLVPRRDVETALVRRVHSVKSAFMALPRTMAGQLVGCNESQIETALDDSIRAILLELSQRVELPEVPLQESTRE